MAETILDTLVVAVKADTSALSQSLKKAQTDLSLLDVAGQSTGKRLTSAFEQFVKTGSLSFDSFKKVALGVLSDIASSALKSGLNSVFGSSGGSGGGIIASLLGAFGLPGRAGGGQVTSGQPYVVGERGPEIFIPQGAGSVQANSAANKQSIAITVNVTGSAAEPRVMARSAGQIAAVVRRSLNDAGGRA